MYPQNQKGTYVIPSFSLVWEMSEINNLIESREQFRKERQFDDADKIRDKLNEMNVELIDHKENTIWMKKENIKAEK